jgi:CDP-glucose 4,6-dehydratase
LDSREWAEARGGVRRRLKFEEALIATAFWQDRSVFVTGGSGLLGSWLIPALVFRGAKVAALVREGSGRSATFQDAWPDAVARVPGEVTDYDLMRSVMADYSVDTTFHLAAQSLVGAARQDPAGTLDVNVRGTWTILEAARATRQCQVLVASSGKAYGEDSGLAYAEDCPLRGRSPYDVSKSCADLISSMYAAAYDLPTGIVRSGNLFGGGDLNFSRSIPGVIRATLRGEPFVIRSDGKATRCFLYVEDAVDAYLLLAERLAEDRSLRGQAFNFGSQQSWSVLEIAEMVLRIAGRQDLEPIILGTASEEAPEQRLSTEKARRVLQWFPRFGMEEGLHKCFDWYAQHFARLDREHACPAVAS